MSVTDERTYISKNWPDLNSNLLMDIYGVHKALKFGQFQRSAYEFTEFRNDVENAEKTILSGTSWSHFLDTNAGRFNLSFYPEFLVHDNVFEVMACHFAVSSVVNDLKKNLKNERSLLVKSVVIPRSVCSRWDDHQEYTYSMGNIRSYLHSLCPRNPHVSRQIDADIVSVPDLANIITEMIASSIETSASQILVVFSRVRTTIDNFDYVTVLQGNDSTDITELNSNYFISFDFSVTMTMTRCWLTFGVNQRLLFYPEYSVWIIPHLFVRPTKMTTYEVVSALYGDNYKHGWRVPLDDEIFNKYYHIITGYEHLSNNYNRDEMTFEQKLGDGNDCGLRDHLDRTLTPSHRVLLRKFGEDQAYDSDGILYDLITAKTRITGNDSNIANLFGCPSAHLQSLKFEIFRFENMECTKDDIHHIDDCEHMDFLIRNLQHFRDRDLEIDVMNVIDFNLDSIINAFDHVVRVHGVLSDGEKSKMLKSYIAERVSCEFGASCNLLSIYSQRKRERSNIEEKDEEPLHEVNTLCDAVSDVLQSVHCYLLHKEKHLYRLSAATNNKFQSRFATPTVDENSGDATKQNAEKKEDGEPSVDFGLNVLQWLPYGQMPNHENLKQEIIRNPESSIDRAVFEQYEIICNAKIKGTKWTSNEMISSKMYSDTTDLQSKLRQAHWIVAAMAVRKAYYHWAMGLYRTHLLPNLKLLFSDCIWYIGIMVHWYIGIMVHWYPVR